MVHSSRADRGWRQNRTEDAPPADAKAPPAPEEDMSDLDDAAPAKKSAPEEKEPETKEGDLPDLLDELKGIGDSVQDTHLRAH